MKRKNVTAIALVLALGIAGSVLAQGRHDEKPHGYDKAKVEAASKGAVKPEAQSSAGGRHDEKPHGVKNAKPKPTATPVAVTPAKEGAAVPGSGKSAQ